MPPKPEDPNAVLSRREYWDKRYDSSTPDASAEDRQKAESYDWLKDFEFVRGFLEKYLPPATQGGEEEEEEEEEEEVEGKEEGKEEQEQANCGPRILHLGNGNSTLPDALCTRLSYRNQTAIDFSEPLIKSMQGRYPRITWRVMDIRELDFATGSFDVCIDKATLDAMLYGSLWDPEDEVKTNVGRYVDEVTRVLRPGGKFLYITWRQPHFIRPLLSRPEKWDISVETINDQPGGGGMLEYFGWVCVRK